jgi:hypothetical protein
MPPLNGHFMRSAGPIAQVAENPQPQPMPCV